MKNSFVLVSLCLLLGSAEAQVIYSCKDASGKTISSDLPMPECASRENRLLNRDGSVKQIIPAPLSPEQKLRKEAEDARNKQAEQERLDGVQRDRALLSAYRTEAELSEAFVRLIGVPTRALRDVAARLKMIHEEITKLKAEAEFFVGKPWPLPLRRRLESVQNLIQQEERNTTEKEAEVQHLVGRYEADLRRYRALIEKANQTKPQ